MKRCEACGSSVREPRLVRRKLVGKIRELCRDCGTKLSSFEEQAVTLA